MADEVKSIDTRTNEGFARVGAEFKSVRAEIVAGGQATSADKVSYGDKTVQQALDDLNYKAIAINSFTNDVGTRRQRASHLMALQLMLLLRSKYLLG